MKTPRKPTEMQQKAIQHLLAGKTKRDAMLAAGYTEASARNPKTSLMGRVGVKTAMDEYRDQLRSAGVIPEVLAEIEAAGLFDENGAVRLGYLKEAKKSLGLATLDDPNPNVKRKVTFEEFFSS